MHHISDNFIIPEVRQIIDACNDKNALLTWIKEAKEELARLLGARGEMNRDTRIEMVNSEIRYIWQRIYKL